MVVHPSWQADSRTFQLVAHVEDHAVLDGNLGGKLDVQNGTPHVDATGDTQENRETCIFDLTVEVPQGPSVVVVLLATYDQEIQ